MAINNAILFNAVLSGVTGGIHQRWLTKTGSSDYDRDAAEAVLFATTVDGLIPTDPSIDGQNAGLMQSICQGVLADRLLQQLSEEESQSVALAIVALYNEVKAALQPVSSGTTGTPLSAAMFVDPNTTVALADQNGSAITPFETIQAAVDALPASGGSVLLTPAVYPEEHIVVADPKTVSFYALTLGDGGPVDLSQCDVTTNSDISIVGVQVIDAILPLAPGGSNVELQATHVAGSIDCGSLTCRLGSTVNGAITAEANVLLFDGSTVIGGVNCDGSLILRDTVVGTSLHVGGNIDALASLAFPGGSIPVGSVCDTVANITGYQVPSFTCFRGSFVSCQLSGPLSVLGGDTSTFRNTTFVAGASIVVTGGGTAGLDFDAYSYDSFLAAGGVVTGDSNLIIPEWANLDPRVYQFEDDFDYRSNPVTAIATTGTNIATGQGNWLGTSNGAAGSLQLPVAVANHPGSVNLRTAATSGNGISLMKGDITATTWLNINEVTRQCSILRIIDVTTMQLVSGLVGVASVNPANGIYFKYDAAVNGNWHCVCRAANVETNVDSGVAVTNNTYYRLQWVRFGDTVWFYIKSGAGNLTLVTPGGISTNVPGAVLSNVGVVMITNTNAVRQYEIDYYSLQSKVLSR